MRLEEKTFNYWVLSRMLNGGNQLPKRMRKGITVERALKVCGDIEATTDPNKRIVTRVQHLRQQIIHSDDTASSRQQA